MFTFFKELGVVLIVQVFGSKKDKQELAACLQRSNESMRDMHQQYLVLDAQTTAITNCVLRDSDEIFSRMHPGYEEELKKQKAKRGLS